MANPTANGGFSFNFNIPNIRRHYDISQEASGSPIRVTFSQLGTANDQEPLFHLFHLPDGQLLVGQKSDASDAKPHQFAGNYHKTLIDTLGERSARMEKSKNLFTCIDNSLRGLRGQYTPESQSMRYSNFVVVDGKVYSFHRENPLGLDALEEENPQFTRVNVFEETDTAQVKVAELNSHPDGTNRELFNHEQLKLFEQLARQLDKAQKNPSEYQRELRASLEKLPHFKSLEPPTIETSVEISRSFRLNNGIYGHIAEFHGVWDLLRNLRNLHAGRRWQNPEDPAKMHNLRPPWRLRGKMAWELLRWTNDRFFETKPAYNWLRLQLFPQGGGRLDIHRDGQLHDIVIADREGRVWSADREIRQLAREKTTFPDRRTALNAALNRRSQGSGLPFAINVQEAPTLDLNGFHIDEAGVAQPVHSGEQAWHLLRQRLPEGTEYLETLLPEDGSRVVDFSPSKPPSRLEIRDRIGGGDEKGSRVVEVVLHRGVDTHVSVFVDGVHHPELSPNLLQKSSELARRGAIEDSIPTRIIRGGAKFYIARGSMSLSYGLSYFLSLPFISGYEDWLYSDGERRLLGTPRLQDYFHWDSIKRNVIFPFLGMATASSASSLLVDGMFNSLPGLRRALFTLRTTEATPLQAWSAAQIRFFNPKMIRRPISPNSFLRGFLQRAVPLFAGIAALDRYDSGQWISPAFRKNMLDVAAVSAASAGLLRLLYSSERLSGALVRRGWLTEAAADTGVGRFGLSFKGAAVLGALEMLAFGVINAHERRALIEETGRSLRQSLGQAIDRRNELLTRLEGGEDIAPRYLVGADAELQSAQASYRRFLELTNHRSGSGTFTAIGFENDFDGEQRRYEATRRAAWSGNDPMVLAQVEAEHAFRLNALQGRYQRMERELDDFSAGQGVNRSSEGEASLRDFLHRQAAQLKDNPAPAAKVASPITIASSEGQAILEQMRLEVVQNPSFVLWNREQRADYILREFRYHVTDANDGTYRRWNRSEALAFLDAVDQADTERANNMEPSLTLPRPEEGFDTSRLEALQRSEQEIRARELGSHTHAAEHAGVLADNIEDFERQMATYYQSTNERMAVALTRIMGEVAMTATSPSGTTIQ